MFLCLWLGAFKHTAPPPHCAGGATGCSLDVLAGEDSPAVTGAGAAAGLTVVVVVLDGAGMLLEDSEVGSDVSGPLRGCGVGRVLLGVTPVLVELVAVLFGGRPTAVSASRRRA